MVDVGESPEEAESREVAEEVGCAPGLINFTTDDHVITHYSDQTHFCLHLFAKEVSLEQFAQLEANATQATHWGIEVNAPKLFLTSINKHLMNVILIGIRA